MPCCPDTPGHPGKLGHTPACMAALERGLTGYPSTTPLSHVSSPRQEDTAVSQQPKTLSQASQIPMVLGCLDSVSRAP